MRETQEIIMAALAQITDEKAERTPVIITYSDGYQANTLYLALTPSQLGLLEILRDNDMLDECVEVTMLTDISWEMP
ncbi:MAG: hypothetical protein IKU45_02050 [Clostridia bacterium]|nr:hypothetical protein [Clostridia bacterium]